MKIVLDAYDVQLLQLLTNNARASYADLGRKIGLSQSATKERVLRLYDEGLIKSFTIDVDYHKMDFGLQVLIQIKFKNDDFKKFIAQLPSFPEIISCKRITGEYCLITECVLKNSAHLENLIDRILPFGIPTTSIQLSEIPIPLPFKISDFK